MSWQRSHREPPVEAWASAPAMKWVLLASAFALLALLIVGLIGLVSIFEQQFEAMNYPITFRFLITMLMLPCLVGFFLYLYFFVFPFFQAKMRQEPDPAPLAFKGDIESMFRLGASFEKGRYPHPQDVLQAREWYQRAAEAGHRQAMIHLAELLEWGPEGIRDLQGASEWRQRAGEPKRPSLDPLPGEDSSMDDSHQTPSLWARWDRWSQGVAERPWFGLLLLLGATGLLVLLGLPILAILLNVILAITLLRIRFSGSSIQRRLEKQAQSGDSQAAYVLGQCYEKGSHPFPREKTLARHWYEKAALAGHGKAMMALAELLFYGQAGNRDVEGAKAWMRRAQGLGVSDARMRLEQWCASGADPEMGLEKSLPSIQESAPPIHPTLSSRNEGSHLDRRQRWEEGWARAFEAMPWLPWLLWLGLAATLLLVLGIYLGFPFFFGKSLPFWVKAFISFTLVAPWLFIYLFIGRPLGSGRGGRLESLRRKAQGGDRNAMFRLATCYEKGCAEQPPDVHQAMTWYERAAHKGHGRAMLRLADLLMWGQGGWRDSQKATMWLKRARQAGETEADRFMRQWGLDGEKPS